MKMSLKKTTVGESQKTYTFNPYFLGGTWLSTISYPTRACGIIIKRLTVRTNQNARNGAQNSLSYKLTQLTELHHTFRIVCVVILYHLLAFAPFIDGNQDKFVSLLVIHLTDFRLLFLGFYRFPRSIASFPLNTVL